MRALTFAEACDYLFPRTSGASGRNWSLGPTEVLLAALGNPERHLAAVHLGGTNGKGSVATMVAEILRAGGYRVGLFTSPHLVDVRERFLVDDVPIPRDAFATWTSMLRPSIERTDASFFEVTTAMALADFAARNVDMAVLEVGLGGRLDSTNVVTPLVSAVTNIALEHTEFLGPRLEDIAREKAGIAKAGVPFVVGDPDPRHAGWLREEATRRGADVRTLPSTTLYAGPLGMVGRHQRRNAAVACAVIEAMADVFPVSEEAISGGLAWARVPGRLDRRGKWLFDVAHNPAGLATLMDHLAQCDPPRPVHALFGVQSDKAGGQMLEQLLPGCDHVWLTLPPTVPADRVADLDVVAREPRAGVTVEHDFDRALSAVQVGAGTVVVTGSFHTVGDAMARLPGFPPLG